MLSKIANLFINNKILKNIFKIYSKIFNKHIYLITKTKSYYFMPNGSTIETIRTTENIRGNRSKYIGFIDDYCDVQIKD
jgi:hypothetical protein